jgi:hypothetical protein
MAQVEEERAMNHLKWLGLILLLGCFYGCGESDPNETESEGKAAEAGALYQKVCEVEFSGMASIQPLVTRLATSPDCSAEMKIRLLTESAVFVNLYPGGGEVDVPNEHISAVRVWLLESMDPTTDPALLSSVRSLLSDHSRGRYTHITGWWIFQKYFLCVTSSVCDAASDYLRRCE